MEHANFGWIQDKATGKKWRERFLILTRKPGNFFNEMQWALRCNFFCFSLLSSHRFARSTLPIWIGLRLVYSSIPAIRVVKGHCFICVCPDACSWMVSESFTCASRNSCLDDLSLIYGFTNRPSRSLVAWSVTQLTLQSNMLLDSRSVLSAWELMTTKYCCNRNEQKWGRSTSF